MHSAVQLAGLSLVLSLWSCASSQPPDGRCTADSEQVLPCGAEYSGFFCTGSARPDDAPKYVEGVPQGSVCADQGARNAEGAQGYCCTMRQTACAYNPVAICDAPYFGYQCRGANRPDALNAALQCGNGVREGDLINYCCTGSEQKPGCLQSDSVSCSSRLMGFTCLGDSLPRGEQLGPNKSRADFFRLLCSAPSPAGNPDYNNYCCFTPAPLPEGGSCIQHTSVPGCAPGRFGFACYGPETPQDDYLSMRCPEPGVPGRSAEGYPAKLYCCDFQ
jgi:hypothetical protein